MYFIVIFLARLICINWLLFHVLSASGKIIFSSVWYYSDWQTVCILCYKRLIIYVAYDHILLVVTSSWNSVHEAIKWFKEYWVTCMRSIEKCVKPCFAVETKGIIRQSVKEHYMSIKITISIWIWVFEQFCWSPVLVELGFTSWMALEHVDIIALTWN